MKKIICILLTLLLTAAFIACGSKKGPNESKDILDISKDPSEYTESNGFWESSNAPSKEASEEASNETSNDDAVSNNSPLVVYPSYNSKNLITLSENDANTILGHLNSITDWNDGTCDCMGDYILEVTENAKTTKYSYSAYDGHLNDITNQRSYNFSESVREEITNILFLAHPIGEVYQPNEESENVTEEESTNENSENGLYTLRVTHGIISYASSLTPPGFARTLESDAEYIINLLENGNWTNDLHKCKANIWVDAEGKYYEYCSECGCFLDKENGRTLAIPTNSRAHIHLNAIFGVYTGKMKLTVHPKYNEGVDIKLSEDDYDEILTLILCASWREGTTDCLADYIFEINKGGWITKYGYHASCGTLNNYTDQLSYSLSDENREEINRILETTPKDLDE